MNKYQKIAIAVIVTMIASIAPATAGIISVEPILNTAQTQLIAEVTLDDNSSVVISSVEAHVIYQPWQTLEQEGQGLFSGVMNIESLSNGNYKLIARYTKQGESPVFAPAVLFTINRPPPPSPVDFDLYVKDTAGQPIAGVQPFGFGPLSDAGGLIHFTTLTLNQTYQIRLNKTDFLDLSTQFIPQHGSLTKTVVMKRPADNLKTLDVQGYENMIAGHGNYIIVKDLSTGEKIDGAMVSLYQGANVQSLPGKTVNGRIFMSIPDSSAEGDFVIEVTKAGYKDFSDVITIFQPTIRNTPTPTPAPAPAPIPTPDRKYRPDANAFLTNDEYRQYIEEREAERTTSNRNQTAPAPTTSPPQSNFGPQQPQDNTPWTLIVMGGLFGLVLINKKYNLVGFLKGNIPNKPLQKEGSTTDLKIRPGIFDAEEDNKDSIKKATLKCDKCDWTMEIDTKQSDEKVQKFLLDNHLQEAHSIRPAKKEKSKEGKEDE